MAEFTFSVLYLGNIAELDTTDGNNTAENQNALLGTYGSSGEPLSRNITTLTAQDTNNDGLINTNDRAAPEAVSYDLGNGPVNTFHDALFNVNVTVNFHPESGEPPYQGLGGIIQTETGDLFFVMIDDDAGLGANSFDNFPIQSLVINSISGFGTQQAATASDEQSFVPCFAAGTRITTDKGSVAIQDLRVGDRVATLDDGFQPVVWIGRKYLGPHDLLRMPQQRAVYVRAGALGHGYPKSDLVVSPQHRLLLRSNITRRMTDEAEILVAAIKLVGFPGISLEQGSGLGVQYHHFACATHQVVWANGALAETLYLGPQVRHALSASARTELALMMPETLCVHATHTRRPVRPIIQKRCFIQNMLGRHLKNGMPLVTIPERHHVCAQSQHAG